MGRSGTRRFSINYEKIFGKQIPSRPLRIKLIKLKQLKLKKLKRNKLI
jgi:hypothetical protein